jgi:hypothetical protein
MSKIPAEDRPNCSLNIRFCMRHIVRRLAVNSTSLFKLLASALLTTAVLAAGYATARAQSSAPSLDVVGIKLGMPVKTAVATMKANNPRLNVQEDTFQLEGFDQVVLSSIVAAVSGEAGKDTERFELGISMPPSPQVVWGIRRTYTYAPQNLPSMDLTVAALRKKYGQENIPADPDPRNLTKSMIWVVDSQGRLLGPGPAHSLYMTCYTPLSNAFSTTSIVNELHGVRMPAECDSVVMVSASVQASANAVPGSIVVGNLIVQVANGPAYRASIEATRKVVMAAATERENKQRQAIDKRGAPKI